MTVTCARCKTKLHKPATSADPKYTPTGRRLPEGRWTKANTFCPHPERWTSQDADSTEWEVSEMIGGLIRGLQPEVVVETGTAWGQTTKVIGRVLIANGHGVCYSLDPDPERVAYSRWYCHDEICAGVVKIRETESLAFVPPEGVIDFLFCDSLYTVRAPELQHFRPWLDGNGMAAVHDTAPRHGMTELNGVDLQTAIEAVDGYKTMRLHTPRGITLLSPA